jgi:phosphatidylinositol alpha-mannosyltransferase
VPFATNGSVAPIAPDPAAALRTFRALREERFDVVHVHEPMVPGPSLYSVLTSDRPVVGTFHRAGASTAYKVAKPLAVLIAKRIAKRCAVSLDAEATAKEALGGDYEITFNGIDVERFAKATPWPTDGPTIFFVGRHEPRKGLEFLLDALPQLPSDVRLWIASDGPQTAALQEKVAGDHRVEWLGRVSDEEVAARLRGADVFCAPSTHGESFGIVLLEAMAAGTAIVASDIPGYRNVATPDLDALMVPPGDVGALAAAVDRLLRDPSLAARLTAAGESRATGFAMDALADRYVGIYRSLL